MGAPGSVRGQTDQGLAASARGQPALEPTRRQPGRHGMHVAPMRHPARSLPLLLSCHPERTAPPCVYPLSCILTPPFLCLAGQRGLPTCTSTTSRTWTGGVAARACVLPVHAHVGPRTRGNLLAFLLFCSRNCIRYTWVPMPPSVRAPASVEDRRRATCNEYTGQALPVHAVAPLLPRQPRHAPLPLPQAVTHSPSAPNALSLPPSPQGHRRRRHCAPGP